MKHKQVISTVANGDSLCNINTVIRSNGFKQAAFLIRVYDRVCWDKFTRQGLRRGVNLKLWTAEISEIEPSTKTPTNTREDQLREGVETYVIGNSVINT